MENSHNHEQRQVQERMRIISQVPTHGQRTKIPPVIITHKPDNSSTHIKIKIKASFTISLDQELHNPRSLHRQRIAVPDEQAERRVIRDETEVRQSEKDN
jgi:hypothetical protein